MDRFAVISVALIALAGCASTTQPIDGGTVDGACVCGAGQICVHTYYTHDPPGPMPDGSPCSSGVPRYGRCWSIRDQCVDRPAACDASSACACPGAAVCGPTPTFFGIGCDVENASSVDCYSIGI